MSEPSAPEAGPAHDGGPASDVPDAGDASRAGRSRLRYVGYALTALIAAAFVALLVYGLAAKSANTTIDDALAKNEAVPAPGFSLAVLERGNAASHATPRLRRALAAGQVSLADLHGMPVVLNFWASWCVPCADEAPLLERTWRSVRRDGVVMVGLDMQDLTEDARAFVGDFDLTYPVLRDRGRTVADHYGVTGFPETFFLSPAGRVVGHVVGVVTAEQLETGIDAARNGQPVGVATGGEQGAARRAPPPAKRPAPQDRGSAG